MRLLLTLACAVSAWAQSDYFPLQVGNQWVLETSSSQPERMTIEVLRSRVVDGRTWYLVSGYAPETMWVREDDDGSLYASDGTLLARLMPGRPGYRTRLSGCDQAAQGSASDVAYRGPNYDASKPLIVSYAPDSCRDVGITDEVYGEGVGLLRRSVTTIRGETTYNLVYARVNGEPVLGKSGEIVLTYDFDTGSKGWLPGFSDYSLQTDDLRMLAELRALPEEIGPARSGYFIQGMNRSDDLFMFLKKQVTSDDGLKANQAYRFAFDIRFASNAPTGCVGVGGSPGDSVYLKAGASAEEPVTTLDAGRDVHITIDKGQQATGGREAGVVGTIGNGTPCERSKYPYVNVRRVYAHPTPVNSGMRNSLWLLVGTDSAFEGLTGLYYQSITVRINPAVSPATEAR